MKIRIQDSTIRFRLSKTDIEKLYKKGKVKSVCQFGTSSKFKYSIVSKDDGNSEFICVYLKKNHIKVELAAQDVAEWYETELEGFDTEMDNDGDGLYLLMEKDWQCLKPREEDESDLYDNPKA